MARNNPWEPPDNITENAGTRRNPWEPPVDARDSSATGRVETAPERTERLDLEHQYQGMGPGRRFRAGVSNMLSGVPILGNYTGNFISNAEDIDVARRARPGLSGVERMTAGTAAYMPASRAAQLGGVSLRNLITRNRNPNLGLAGELTTQGTLGASVALADRPPRSSEEAVINGILGFGTGAIGPLGGRLLGPSGVGNRIAIDPVRRTFNDPRAYRLLRHMPHSTYNRIMRIPDGATFEREMLRELNRIRGRQLARTTGRYIDERIPGILGAGLGYHTGGALGAALGYTAGESGRRLISAATRSRPGQWYLGRQITPNMAALLSSIGPTYFSNIDDNPTNSAIGR